MGLVGYEDGGLLTNAINENPHCVLFLDEIEKTDRVVYNTFLQVLDYGTLKDTKGNKVDFSNTIIIMTSLILPDTLYVKIVLHLSNYMLKCKV